MAFPATTGFGTNGTGAMVLTPPPKNDRDVWAFHSDTPLVAGTEYVKISGSNDGTASYTNIANQPVCYSMGTLIDTPNGPTAVEVLRPGDLV